MCCLLFVVCWLLLSSLFAVVGVSDPRFILLSMFEMVQ